MRERQHGRLDRRSHTGSKGERPDRRATTKKVRFESWHRMVSFALASACACNTSASDEASSEVGTEIVSGVSVDSAIEQQVAVNATSASFASVSVAAGETLVVCSQAPNGATVSDNNGGTWQRLVGPNSVGLDI